MNLLSLLAQIGFNDVSKGQVRAEIENNIPAKKVVQASIITILSIEEKYAVLIEKAEDDREIAKKVYNKIAEDIRVIDVSQAEAVTALIELEAQRAVAETKAKVADKVIQSLHDKKKSELVTEVVNAYQLGLNAMREAHLILDHIKQVVTTFNISLLTEVLSEIDAEMRDVDYHINRVTKETGVSKTNVNGLYMADRDFYIGMAYKLK